MFKTELQIRINRNDRIYTDNDEQIENDTEQSRARPSFLINSSMMPNGTAAIANSDI